MLTLAAVILSAGLTVQAAPPPQQTKPTPSVAGVWLVEVDLENPNASSTLDLKVDGTKVTGTMTSAAAFDVAGEWKDGKLTFSIQYNANTTVTFTGAFK